MIKMPINNKPFIKYYNSVFFKLNQMIHSYIYISYYFKQKLIEYPKFKSEVQFFKIERKCCNFWI